MTSADDVRLVHTEPVDGKIGVDVVDGVTDRDTELEGVGDLDGVLLGVGARYPAVITLLLEELATETKTSKPIGPPHATDVQKTSETDVRIVQVIPLGEVITRLPVPDIATATNN